MESTHFLTLFIGLAICSLLIGLYASKHIHTQADYYLANRKVKTLPLALTLVATQIGGGLILGTADQAYVSGIYGLAYAIGVVLSFVFLALGFAGKLRSFMQRHYSSWSLDRTSLTGLPPSLPGRLYPAFFSLQTGWGHRRAP